MCCSACIPGIGAEKILHFPIIEANIIIISICNRNCIYIVANRIIVGRTLHIVITGNRSGQIFTIATKLITVGNTVYIGHRGRIRQLRGNEIAAMN